MNWRRAGGLAALPVLLAASPDAGAAVGGGSPHAARANLFISPMGQPFRAKAGEAYPVARWFAQADRNGDGRIDRAEFRADAEAFFRMLDTDHDGVIDGFELSAYETDMTPEILGVYGPGWVDGVRGDGRRGDGGKDARPRRGKGGTGDAGDNYTGGAVDFELLNLPEPVAAADINLNGRITLAEFLAAADQRFSQLDPKGRGYLMLADLPKTPVQKAAEAEAAAERKARP